MQSGEIFFEHERWGRNLAWSAGLDGGFSVAIGLYALLARGGSGSNWGAGGGGSAMGVTLTSTIPLPANPVQTQNVLATESKGLSQSKPQERVEEPDAIPIAQKSAKKKPLTLPTATQRTPTPQPGEQAKNVVPYGEGGQVSGPYSMFSAGGAKGGLAFSGGGGDFGARLAWYGRVVNEKVSGNWLKYEVYSRNQNAERVYVTFDIDRGGRPSHVEVGQASGLPALDISAVRALQRIATFGPLPPGYSGNKVSVGFWFGYKR